MAVQKYFLTFSSCKMTSKSSVSVKVRFSNFCSIVRFLPSSVSPEGMLINSSINSIIRSQLPSSSKSKFIGYSKGSLFIKTWGILSSTAVGIKQTGLTFIELPMTMTKSALSLSSVIWLWNASDKGSPKKTISGFITGMGSSLLRRSLSMIWFLMLSGI